MTGRSGRDTKVLLSIFGPIAVLSVALGFVHFNTLAVNRDRVEAQLERQQDLITDLAAAGMQANFREVFQKLEQLGVVIASSKDQAVQSEEVSRTYEALVDRVDAVAYFDASGRKSGSVSSHEALDRLPADCRFAEFFTTPKLTMVPYLSPLTKLADGEPVIYISYPVRAEGTGEFAGITLAQLDGDALSSLCSTSAGIDAAVKLYYYDQHGQCVCPSTGASPDVRPYKDRMAAGAEVSGTFPVSGEGGQGKLHMHPVQVEGYRWYTATVMPLSGLDKMARDDFMSLFLTGGFFILSLAMGGVYFLRVYKAKDQAEVEASCSAALAAQSEALADEKEKLLAVTNSIPDGIMLLDGEGRVLVANNRLKDILGVSPTGGLDMDLTGLPDDFPLRPLLGPEGTGEAVIGNKTYQVLVIPVGRPGQDGLKEIRLLRDITVEKSLAQKKADLVSMITHDVKSPLSTIIGLSQWIGKETKDCGCASDDVRSGLDAITRAGSRILNIMENFLFLSSIEGMRKLNRQEISLDVLVTKAVLEFQMEARNRDISLDYCLAEPSPVVSVDETQISRAVANLLGNALKYTPEGGRVSVATKNFRSYVTISVSDTGPGISRQDMPFVFDRYFRSKSASAGVKGSGLGLAIAKAVVEAHGGTIDVSSEEGAGTTFTLRLPLYQPGENN
ncbi:MAG: sensor histidine kinase [Nitrospirae bacterium]|nr:sensor histidine kinase [Nitrospirota bacterium]MBI5694248.1 sensor histidine kinase [Nitrospirota bacterium]